MVESLSHGSRFMQSFPLNTQQDRREERRGEGRGEEERRERHKTFLATTDASSHIKGQEMVQCALVRGQNLIQSKRG